MPDQLRTEIILNAHHHFSMQFIIFKKRVYFRPLMLLRVYSDRFLMLRNDTGTVVPRAFHSCWKLLAFDQIQFDAYFAVVWRRFEATFKLWPVIPIFERNEMTYDIETLNSSKRYWMSKMYSNCSEKFVITIN